MSCPGSPTMNRPQMLHDGGVGARTPATTAGLVRRGGLVALALAVVLLAVVVLSACSAASPRITTAPGTAADFNRYFGDAASDHFVRGYHVIYGSNDGSTTIEVAVFEFATPAGAAAFKADSVSVSGGLIKSKADPVIPAADDFDSSSADLGIYTRGVIATKGNRAFVITGTTNSADPVPVVQTMARQQYAAL